MFGRTILHPSHPEVRRLQHEALRPALHGHKVWPSSFVLLDYLYQRGVTPQARVLELGCGWGLVSIFCAKTFQAQVTGLDADAAMFPLRVLPKLAGSSEWLVTRRGNEGKSCGE
jgi:predicted nicotinamide N-methyase